VRLSYTSTVASTGDRSSREKRPAVAMGDQSVPRSGAIAARVHTARGRSEGPVQSAIRAGTYLRYTGLSAGDRGRLEECLGCTVVEGSTAGQVALGTIEGDKEVVDEDVGGVGVMGETVGPDGGRVVQSNGEDNRLWSPWYNSLITGSISRV